MQKDQFDYFSARKWDKLINNGRKMQSKQHRNAKITL